MVKSVPNSLKDQVYDAIFSDIINGIYPPNSIINEKSLMEKYNVSRAPIREALTQLTGTHLISSIPRQGYKILRFDRNRLLEIIKFRSALECSFLQNNFEHFNKAWIQDLQEICAEYSNFPDNDFIARWRSNSKFHLKLISVSGNQYAYKMLEDALTFQTFFFVNKHYRPTLDLHHALINYIEMGDVSMAASLLKADIENLLIPVNEQPPLEKE